MSVSNVALHAPSLNSPAVMVYDFLNTTSEPVKSKFETFELFKRAYKKAFCVFKTSKEDTLKSFTVIVEPGRAPEQTPETEVVATIVKDLEDPLTAETLL